MRPTLNILSLFFCLWMSFIICGCGAGGTETGNPTDEDQPESADAGTVAQQILDQLCFKLTECFENLTIADCQTGILQSSQIDTELGLEQGSFDSYQEIINAEQVGDILPDNNDVTTCLIDIAALECDAANVVFAYDPNDEENFDNVENMVPEGENSCEGTY